MFTQQDLTLVVEGMEVYDRDNNRLGTVKAFRLGEGTIKTNATDIVTISDAISECLSGRKGLPTVLYSRLYEEGFIYIYRGLFRQNRVAFPAQIEDISANSIFLNVEIDQLTKV